VSDAGMTSLFVLVPTNPIVRRFKPDSVPESGTVFNPNHSILPRDAHALPAVPRVAVPYHVL